MDSSAINISIYSDSDLVFQNFKEKFEEKGFAVERINSSSGNLGDYLIVDFATSTNPTLAKEVLKNSTSKLVSLIKHDQENLFSQLCSLNNYCSIAKVNDLEGYDYTESLLKELFSFGHIGKSFNLTGGKAIKREVNLPQTATTVVPAERRIIKPVSIKKWKVKISEFKVKRSLNLKWPVIILTVILLLFSLSATFQILAVGSLYLGSKSLYTNIDNSKKFLSISQNLGTISASTAFGVQTYENSFETLVSLQNLFSDALSVIEDSKLLFEKTTGDEIYDVEAVTNSLSASLDKLYSDLGFFETLINNQPTFWSKIIKQKLASNFLELPEIRNKVYSAKLIASRADTLLGSAKAQKYLVLFQNNMELRPAGGFIGSFALITFEGGRMIDIAVSDVYSADGQLKGYVEPPQPIKDILGEANWYLRDSNWDPDFAQSAQRAEWFLDKEIDLKVDGVVSLDMNVVKGLLGVTGDIRLADFNQTVNAQNVYQITQNEMESNFFPGSTKKASFLTSLSRSLLLELENLPSPKKPALLKALYEGLDQKHIQVFSHDTNTQTALSELGFGGGVEMSTNCGERCFFDKYMLVDANLGVNKANLFVDRQHQLAVTVNRNGIKHQLDVDYTNSANSSLGAAGKYKSYTRLLLPVNAKVESVKILNQNGLAEDLEFSESVTDTRKEIGFMVEVLPLYNKKIQIEWGIETDKLVGGGEYRLKVFKQSGTENDPLSIIFNRSDLWYVVTSNSPSLTAGSLPSYNTLLGKDLTLKSFFSIEAR